MDAMSVRWIMMSSGGRVVGRRALSSRAAGRAAWSWTGGPPEGGAGECGLHVLIEAELVGPAAMAATLAAAVGGVEAGAAEVAAGPLEPLLDGPGGDALRGAGLGGGTAA